MLQLKTLVQISTGRLRGDYKVFPNENEGYSFRGISLISSSNPLLISPYAPTHISCMFLNRAIIGHNVVLQNENKGESFRGISPIDFSKELLELMTYLHMLRLIPLVWSKLDDYRSSCSASKQK